MDVNISVIIPVYNVDGYLQRCLQSLEEQTIFDRLEIVLVDDGSTDASGALCDEFAARHENVRVFHKSNGGVSAARNDGIERATGNYYLFLDSDDFLRADACELLAKTAQDERADFVVFQEMAVYDDKVRVVPPKFPPRRIIGNKAVFAALCGRSGGLVEVVSDKLIRAELFKGLRFPVGMKCEDTFISPSLTARAERVIILGEYLYYYRVRPGSIMHTRGDTMVDDRVAAHEEIVRVARKSYPESLEAAKSHTHFVRLRCINTIFECPHYRRHPSWKRHIRELREQLPDVLRTKNSRWMPVHRKVYAVLVCVCPDLACAYVRIRFRKLRKELVFK